MLILFMFVVTPCTEGESTLEPYWGSFRLSLKCFLGSTGALQHRGIRDPGLSLGGVFYSLWFWLLVRIALCL
ncbi:hypothetical protein BJ878DRAFT_530582 [Calycina marina]|uniref:Uncharacterized protein n=1 Tax=Calycina marina TaxID=1763456 RepID=A0A9P8CAE6_9HELO|nr:hypothetical protein BJ878DRAFT_530582 [Calycina marina]